MYVDIWDDHFKQGEQKVEEMGNEPGMFEEQKEASRTGDEQAEGRELQKVLSEG